MSNLTVVNNLEEMEKYSKYFIASGMFPDIQTLSRAVVKIMAGQELGRSPFWSMKNINIIQGKPELSAGALADLVKSSGRYDYVLKEWNDERCVIDWFDFKNWGNKKSIGQSSFSMAEAAAVGLATKDNWKKWPKAMLFARALSQGLRTFAPDVVGGTIYYENEIQESIQVIQPKEIANDKEKARIEAHIAKATEISDLVVVEDLVDSYNLREAFTNKLAEINSKLDDTSEPEVIEEPKKTPKEELKEKLKNSKFAVKEMTEEEIEKKLNEKD